MRISKKPVKFKHTVSQDIKTKFRRSKEWKAFRNKIKKLQKDDPVTLKPLSNTFNLHHLVVDPDQYTDISQETHFIGLNSQTHEIIHWLWGDASKRKDWRGLIERIVKILITMDALNG